jgi:hypothetical protein
MIYNNKHYDMIYQIEIQVVKRKMFFSSRWNKKVV